jgi:hypothetical protein
MNCSICGNAGHKPSRCAELRAPLKEGFQGGGGGGGGHSHDEDDEEKSCAFLFHDSDFIVADESCAERSAKARAPRAPVPAPAQHAAPRQTRPAP